jgi:hypothetical protein
LDGPAETGSDVGTTINSQRLALGALLRQYRVAAGLSSADVERELHWHDGKSARVERGFRVPVAAEVARLIDMYRVPRSERDKLMQLADAARKREQPSRVADFAQTYLAMERDAVEIRYLDSVLIHGLLQTEGYARAIVEQAGSGREAEERAPERIARQRILDGPRPPVIRALLGEMVTLQEVGGPAVLREQLLHLVDLTQRDTISVRIIPATLGAHRGLGVGFTHLRLDQPVPLERVYIEGWTDATYLTAPHEVAEYAASFDALWARAADDQESVRILRRHIDRIGGQDGSHTMA